MDKYEFGKVEFLTKEWLFDAEVTVHILMA